MWYWWDLSHLAKDHRGWILVGEAQLHFPGLARVAYLE